MSLEKVKTVIDIATSLATTAALVIGGCFGAYQYLEKARDDRVKETLAFFDRYNRDAVLKARLEQNGAWDPLRKEEQRIPGSQYDGFTYRIILEKKLESSISVLNDFYAALRVCATNDICDHAVALQLFQEDACTFFNRNYSYIDAQRRDYQDSSIGLGTERFAGDPEGSPEVSCMHKQPAKWYDRFLLKRR